MHPLIYYTIVEFERTELLQRVEMERKNRERQERQRRAPVGRRVGHGLVAPARPTALARLAAVLRGGGVTPNRPAMPADRSASSATTIGCRA